MTWIQNTPKKPIEPEEQNVHETTKEHREDWAQQWDEKPRW
jgi:hypothetical protein